jgi:hypothetical protein
MRGDHYTYNEHANHGDHANYGCEAIVLPASTVCKSEDRVMYVAMWSHDPKWYDDAEHAQGVKNEYYCFRQRQALDEEYIE